ncbi:MAG: sporulation protein YqfD [Defluviitaleaceae bacterium]|nr:sporulation protein YqfD [Defluviitaleaceae bacterium]
MILNIWQNIKGYVVIEVTGFSVERFVNLAVHKGLYIWDVSYEGASVRMKVTIKGFKALKDCARKTGCRYKIVEKHGAPFTMHKFRKRKLFPLGILAFVALLYYLSGFVWLVEVEGNERLESALILEFLGERGLAAGERRRSVDRQNLAREASAYFDDISFINIGIRGTKATVSIAETLPREEIIDKSRPCDIIARGDGIITSVFVSRGTPMVREGDVVLRGDVLVSGTLVVGEGDEAVIIGQTHSIAQVRARQYYEMNFNISRTETRKNFTGRTRRSFSLNILNKELNFLRYSNLYENYDRITDRRQLGFGANYPLPIIFLHHTYKEFETYEITRSLEEMRELTLMTITNRIIREFDFDADVIEKIVEYEQINYGLRVMATVITNENIGEVRYLDEVEDMSSQ